MLLVGETAQQRIDAGMKLRHLRSSIGGRGRLRYAQSSNGSSISGLGERTGTGACCGTSCRFDAHPAHILRLPTEVDKEVDAEKAAGTAESSARVRI